MTIQQIMQQLNYGRISQEMMSSTSADNEKFSLRNDAYTLFKLKLNNFADSALEK